MMKHIHTIVLLLLMLLPLGSMAQQLTIVEDITHVQYGSVLTSYRNEFGACLKQHVDDNAFPYALIRMQIDGNPRSVKIAKEQFRLYMGQHYSTKSRITDQVNQILFLVPANAGHIELQAGDGYKSVLLIDQAQLVSDAIYDVRVHFEAVDEMNDNGIKTQYFKFRLTPSDAIVRVEENGEMKLWNHETEVASKELPYGRYRYVIESPRYHLEEGEFIVSDNASTNERVVQLRPQYGWLMLRADESSKGAHAYAIDPKNNQTIALAAIPFSQPKELDSGIYHLTVQRDRYKNYETMITIKDGDTLTLRPQLEANFVRLTLLVDSGVTIYKGLTSLGEGSWTGELECGTHTFETRKINHAPSFTTLDITMQSAGESYSLKSPTPIMTTLKINGTPYDASVYVDGEYKGVTPLVINDILIGSHELRIEHKGYNTFSEEVVLEEGQPKDVAYTLSNDPETIYQLGKDYYNGENGKIKDYNQAFTYFRQAAEMGHVDAMEYLGYCYQLGRGVEENHTEALRCFLIAGALQMDEYNLSEIEFNRLQFKLFALSRNDDYAKSYKIVLNQFREKAMSGTADAQYLLGYCYYNGRDSLSNKEEGLKWYLKAAEQGHLLAQYRLGECYDHGNGVKKDYDEAIKWFLKAAEQGNKSAQYALAQKYQDKHDFDDAIAWYIILAENGKEPIAEYKLGKCYEEKEDYITAVKWYRKAAANDNADAMRELGECYEYGRGVELSYDEAIYWYEKCRTNTKDGVVDIFCAITIKDLKAKALPLSSPTSYHRNHGYVDLGLSVMWATCNVGASNPEDFGDYFAWGETKPKSTYDWSTYKWCQGTENTQTKYCIHADFGTVDNKTTLDMSDDAAHKNWGGEWRMPTYSEWLELIDEDNCTILFMTQNGVTGCKFVSKINGNSIFLPAAGCIKGNKNEDIEKKCCYSAGNNGSILNSEDYEIFIDGGKGEREIGLSVRPVCSETGKVSNRKAIETFTVKGVSFNMIKVVSAADSARYHQKVLSVCDMIRQKVMDYSTLSQYMTSKGVNDYKKLMENDSVYVISTDVCRFVRLGTDVQCRSVPMKFISSNGKNYIENVVFTIDKKTNKINGIRFALEERSVRNIMENTDINEKTRMMLFTFMENYKTAFSMKNWDYIESVFADDAVIITGDKMIQGEASKNYVSKNKINDNDFIKQTKSQYISLLTNTKKKWINIKFGNTHVEKSNQQEMYAITLLQDYDSSHGDHNGYLFLLIDANDSKQPLIRIQTWQPESAGTTPITLK